MDDWCNEHECRKEYCKMSHKPYPQDAAAVERTRDGEPIPDGYRYLTFRNSIAGDDEEPVMYAKLEFREYMRGFTWFPKPFDTYDEGENGLGFTTPGLQPVALVARNNDGSDEFFFVNNILYMEQRPNSPAYIGARQDWDKKQQAEEEEAARQEAGEDLVSGVDIL
jgi:hypothetical protein